MSSGYSPPTTRARTAHAWLACCSRTAHVLHAHLQVLGGEDDDMKPRWNHSLVLCVWEDAFRVQARGCNPMCWSLQPHPRAT